VQFHLTKEGKLGYVGVGTSIAKGIIPITECHLPEESINSLWPQLEFEPDTNIERISLRVGKENDLMLILESDSPESPELEIEAEISVAHVFEENAVVIAGNDQIVIPVLGRDFRISAASFFQVNTALAEKMVQHLLACLPVSLSTTLLDVYCGVVYSVHFLHPDVNTLSELNHRHLLVKILLSTWMNSITLNFMRDWLKR
jgi:23S rRNA (uracil1939-C5)-methyltransferase